MFYSRLLSSSALAPSLTPIIWIYFHKLRHTFMAVWALTFCWFSVLVQAHVARLPVYLYAALRSFDQHCRSGWRDEGVRFAFLLMDRQSLDFRVKRAGWVAELKMKHLQLNCLMSNFLNMLMLLKSGWLENTKLDLWSGSFKRDFKVQLPHPEFGDSQIPAQWHSQRTERDAGILNELKELSEFCGYIETWQNNEKIINPSPSKELEKKSDWTALTFLRTFNLSSDKILQPRRDVSPLISYERWNVFKTVKEVIFKTLISWWGVFFWNLKYQYP